MCLWIASQGFYHTGLKNNLSFSLDWSLSLLLFSCSVKHRMLWLIIRVHCVSACLAYGLKLPSISWLIVGFISVDERCFIVSMFLEMPLYVANTVRRNLTGHAKKLKLDCRKTAYESWNPWSISKRKKRPPTNRSSVKGQSRNGRIESRWTFLVSLPKRLGRGKEYFRICPPGSPPRHIITSSPVDRRS